MSMNRRRFFCAGTAGMAGVLLGVPLAARAQAKDKIKMAWTNTVIVSAQVQHVLRKTDIAKNLGIELEMIQMTSSAAINEAIVSGAADIGSVSDFSAVMLMAAGAPVKSVAHQSSFRSAILTRTGSGLEKLTDLKGKKIYGLFGITAYQNAQAAVVNAGLTLGKDVEFVNIGTAELADAVRTGKIDAWFTWDPWVAFFEQQKLGKTISYNVTPTMVLQVRDKFLKAQRPLLQKFILAHSEALFYATRNKDLTTEWFRSMDPARGIPKEVIDEATLFDPQWSITSFDKIRSAISPEEINVLQGLAQWGYEQKLLPRVPKVADYVDTSVATEVDKSLGSIKFDPAEVKIIA